MTGSGEGKRESGEPKEARLFRRKGFNLLAFIAMTVLLMGFIFLLVEPESAKIQRTLKKHAGTLDAGRFSKEPAYRNTFQSEEALLQFHLAQTYNGEREPNLAIPILETLIKKSETPRGISGKTAQPDAEAFSTEAYYWEELANSFKLKNEKAGMERALEERDRLRREAKRAAKKSSEK